MSQSVQQVSELPESPLAASATFFENHLSAACDALANPDVTALAILLPAADTSHDDWRRSLARDLAREFTPQRVNVVGSGGVEETEALVDYLAGATGVTGHYCAAHE